MMRRFIVDRADPCRVQQPDRGRTGAPLAIMTVLMATVLAACTPAGTSAVATASTATATPSSSADTPPEAIGLKIDAMPWKSGIRCPSWIDHRHAQVVAASDGRAYGADELSQMSAYAQTVATTDEHPLQVDKEIPPAALLREVNGVPTSASAPLDPGVTGRMFGPTCAFQFELTNVGTGVLEVTKAGVRLTGRPEANTATYRLVDMCSLGGISHYCGPMLGGGPTPCGYYAALLQLSDGQAGTLSEQPPLPARAGGRPPQCPGLVINPAQTVDLRVDLWSSQNLIFPVEPVLSVATAGGERLVPIPSQAGRAAFANADQFSCLKLQHDAFVPLFQGLDALSLDAQSPHGAWCL